MTDYMAQFTAVVGLAVLKTAQRIRKWRKYNTIIISLNVLLIISSIVVTYFLTDKNWILVCNIATALFSTWLGFYSCVNFIEITNYDTEQTAAAMENKLSKTEKLCTVLKSILNVLVFYVVYPISFLTLCMAVLIYFVNYMAATGNGKPEVAVSPLTLAAFIITLGGFIVLVYANGRHIDNKDVRDVLKPLLLAVISFLALFIILQMVQSPFYETYQQSIATLSGPDKIVNELFIAIVPPVAAAFIVFGSIALADGLIMSINLIKKM
ncbi:MAG: hypothetical protein PHO26_02165 [Dehalococcoidia bacterium]|nr:hypothetical protein [Dehalococcoidia bacterium]MDD5494580.1 hypothetical protein [Dehalococcoidia bacterium]